MATKAELEAELAQLKRDLKRRDQADKSDPPPNPSNADAPSTPSNPDNPDDLRGLLHQHGIDTDTLDGLGDTLLQELTALQKDKPLVMLVAALALGILIGRTFR